MKIYARKALLDGSWHPDIVIRTEGGIITAVESGKQGDLQVDCLAPGLIDNHNHGGYGRSVMTAQPEEFADWLGDLARKGTTAVTAGIYTAPVSEMQAAIARTARAYSLQQAGHLSGSRLLGIHLEGPFVSPEKPGTGAMAPDAIAHPDIPVYDEIVAGHEDLIREISLAPEMDENFQLIHYLRQKGVRILAGHTNASYEMAVQAFANGVGAICHFFNASAGIHHRAPGVLTAALLNPEIVCEAICDFVHVHPAALRLLYACKGRDRFMIISDAVTMTGLPDCTYQDGEDLVIQKEGVSRLAQDGSLAGGGAYSLDGVKKLVSLGIPSADALTMASRTPARWLGREDLGQIRAGCKADLLALDDQLNCVFSLVGGRLFDGGT